MYYRSFLKSDIDEYIKRASTEFKPDDFCDKGYLLERWNKLKCFILLDENDDWIGWCALSFKDRDYNPKGVHFLAGVIFPKYRACGYSKYLFKIRFDHTENQQKSSCVSAKNKPSIRNMEKYGFVQHGTHKIWNLYLCSANYYPSELKEISLEFHVKKKQPIQISKQNFHTRDLFLIKKEMSE